LEILIAEDDINTASAYTIALEDRGHHVLITDNGERCLEIYNEKLQDIRLNHPSAGIKSFDVVILDHMMLQIKGVDVARDTCGVSSSAHLIGFCLCDCLRGF
jgi:DNA-binding response OmpR family regulator